MRQVFAILVLLALALPLQAQRDGTPVHVVCDSGCGTGGVGASVDISSVAGNIIIGPNVPVAFSTPQHVIVDSGAGGGGLTDAELRASAVSVNFTNTSIVLGAGAATIGAVNLAQYTPNSGRLPVFADINGSVTVTNGGTFGVQATLAAETTKVIGTVNQGTSPWTVNLITGFALAATQTDRTQKTQITDGTRDGTVKAASTLPLATDTALVTTLRDALPAGTSLVGKVGIDQTTPGTTNRVDVGTFPANQPFNIAQYGGSATTLGQKTGANSIPVVLASDALPPPDRAATGSISGAGGSVTILSPGTGTTSVSISGIWGATLAFFGVDGSGSVVAITGVNHLTGAVEFSTTANGAWAIPSAGWSTVMVFATAYTSGNANVALITSPGTGVLALGKSLPSGTNLIGGILSNVAPGTTAPTNLDLIGGKTNDPTPQYQPLPLSTGGSAVVIAPIGGPALALRSPFKCNALRKTNCS